MSNPLHAAHYADQAVQETVEIAENIRLARDTYRVRVRSPEIARRIIPGQFVMLRLAGVNDPLIGRPLALYDTVLTSSGKPEQIDVVYLVKGKLTSRLCHMRAGQSIEVWGPLGNGFFHDSPPAEHVIMVAGGIGYTPFLALAQETLGQKSYGDPSRKFQRASRVTMCYGARSADYLASIEDFERLGVEMFVATDDGSRGHHGLVTDLLKSVLRERAGSAAVVCCGPEKMMEAAARIACQANVPCQVSLETPMACGIGICFTCVAKVRQSGGGWDYKRTCVEGPVFEAELIEW